jgi:hypothetical protein
VLALRQNSVILHYNTKVLEAKQEPETIMMTLKQIRKFKVPNRLAIVGALLLAVSTLAGVTQPVSQTMSSAMLANEQQQLVSQPADNQSRGSAKAKKHRGFKVSLLLLRLR